MNNPEPLYRQLVLGQLKMQPVFSDPVKWAAICKTLATSDEEGNAEKAINWSLHMASSVTLCQEGIKDALSWATAHPQLQQADPTTAVTIAVLAHLLHLATVQGVPVKQLIQFFESRDWIVGKDVRAELGINPPEWETAEDSPWRQAADLLERMLGEFRLSQQFLAHGQPQLSSVRAAGLLEMGPLLFTSLLDLIHTQQGPRLDSIANDAKLAIQDAGRKVETLYRAVKWPRIG